MDDRRCILILRRRLRWAIGSDSSQFSSILLAGAPGDNSAQGDDRRPGQHLELARGQPVRHLGAGQVQDLLLLQVVGDGIGHPSRAARQEEVPRLDAPVGLDRIRAELGPLRRLVTGLLQQLAFRR